MIIDNTAFALYVKKKKTQPLHFQFLIRKNVNRTFAIHINRENNGLSKLVSTQSFI
jgi:hypothetical protein